MEYYYTKFLTIVLRTNLTGMSVYFDLHLMKSSSSDYWVC